MKITIRIFQIIAGVLGLSALTLGLLYWIARINLLNIHMTFGMLVALSLLVISILVLRTKETRIMGVIGIIYAIILPIVGVRQSTLLIGDLHWLIQTLHMLLGIGAFVYAGIMGKRYLDIRQAISKAVVL